MPLPDRWTSRLESMWGETAGDSFDVIMAAYPSIRSAGQDFDAFVKLVKDKTVASEGVILVEHDADGQVKVTQTGDHLGRKGLGCGGGVGLVVGSSIEQGLGDKLAPGTAVIIAVVDDDGRLAAERALAGSLAKSVAAMGKKGLGELKAALAEAAGKFSPDRTVLPIPDRAARSLLRP